MPLTVNDFDISMMRRCIELAKLGMGHTAPNPMVGAVIVHEGKIIGEGYHHRYGEAHAEVNAIRSVKNVELLKSSTIYVSLEPCSHYGKTPPCADKIIEMGIPRVVVGSTDPHDKVNGKGIEKLRNAGIEVVTGVLVEECDFLNRRFFTYHRQHRPYIILKWAQTEDGYMDIDRSQNPDGKYWLTRPETGVLVHKWRSEEQAILIGYNTYRNDRPQLTTRHYPGNNPKRYIMARQPDSLSPIEGFTLLPDDLPTAIERLYNERILSVIVEGGRKTLDQFIAAGLWDEARILTAPVRWGAGTPAPIIKGNTLSEMMLAGDQVKILQHADC